VKTFLSKRTTTINFSVFFSKTVCLLEKKKNTLFWGKSRVLLLSEAMLTVISISAKTGQMSAHKARLSNCNF